MHFNIKLSSRVRVGHPRMRPTFPCGLSAGYFMYVFVSMRTTFFAHLILLNYMFYMYNSGLCLMFLENYTG